MWATYSREVAQPPGHLQFYRRGRNGPHIISPHGSASSTETAIKWHYSSWCNHLRYNRLHVFGPFQLYGFYLWFWGSTLLKRTPAGNELGIDLDLRGLSFDISLNKSEWPVGLGCDFVHMSFPTELAGEIHHKVPGAADGLQYLCMQYILRLERGPWGCHHHNLVLGVVKVSKGAKIRNRYNQVPHLTEDTNGKVTNLQLDTTNKSQEVNPFPAGDHKTHINRRPQRHSEHKTENKHKRSTKEVSSLIGQ